MQTRPEHRGQLILADLSAEGEGNYYATAESNGNGVLYVNMGDSIISNMRALEFFAYNPGGATDWLNLTSTTEFGIPNYVALGTFTGSIWGQQFRAVGEI